MARRRWPAPPCLPLDDDLPPLGLAGLSALGGGRQGGLGQDGSQVELAVRFKQELVQSVVPLVEAGVRFHKEVVVLGAGAKRELTHSKNIPNFFKSLQFT